MNIFNYINIASIFIFIISAFILFTLNKGNRNSNRFLAILLSIITFQSFILLLFTTRKIIEFPYLAEIEVPILFLIPPMYFLYTKSLFHNKLKFRRRDLAHFLPAVSILAFLLPFFISPLENKQLWLEKSFTAFHPLKYIYQALFFTQFFVYIYLTLKYLRKNVEFINEVKGLPLRLKKWNRDLSYLSMFYLLLVFIPLFMSFSIQSLYYVPLFNFIFYAILVFRILFYPEIFEQLENVNDIISDYNKYKESVLSEKDMDDIVKMMKEYLLKSKQSLNPNLTLTLLANEMKIPVHHLSQTIYVKLNTNFTDYIKSF